MVVKAVNNDNLIRALLIEDNRGDARLIREMLAQARQVTIRLDIMETLNDGLLQLAETGYAYDIILLDLTLPDSMGLDTLINVRTHAPDVAIIVMTGTDDENLGIQAVRHGAQDYLIKGDVDTRLLQRAIYYAMERHRSEAALRRSEEEYRSLINDVFDTSLVGVIIMDRSLTVVWCNEAMEVYFGVEREEIIGRNKLELVDERLKCAFENPDEYASRIRLAYEQGTFERFECHILPDEKREERWLEHWTQAIHSGLYAGGYIGQYTDVTERKRLEIAELEQRQFAEALTEIGTLLTSTLDLNEVLERILNNLGRVAQHDSAAITMLEDDHALVVRPRSDSKRDTQEIVAEKQLQLDYDFFLQKMMSTESPVVVDDLQAEEAVRPTAMQANVHAYMGAPIKLQNKIIGFINVFADK
ncbi:MAG TPA: response regulator, partial [Phototrophicaceae bacterium]|nr:response regulator [Phototrophicaceae bacterium]